MITNLQKSIAIFPLICIILLSGCSIDPKVPSLENGDWPQYRADAGRTGFTPHQLSSNLALRWQYQQKPPVPAWKGVHTRMTFDYAYQPVIAGNTLFYGSSADGKVYALDTRTGAERWSFFTNAPVRFAPAVWHDRVLVTSDDGWLYCLAAETGKLLWQKRGGPRDAMILGNDRMISRWPARGGVVIKDNVVYFGAGIWPSEGIYLYALNPESGAVLWVNDDSGGLEWDQPHEGARAKSGISVQGYLVAGGTRLFVPTGRAVPAALDLTTGKLAYFHLQQHRNYGGSRVLATDSLLLVTSGNTRDYQEVIGTRQALFDANTGQLLTANELNSRALAISPGFIFYIDNQDHQLTALERDNLVTKKDITNRKGEIVQQNFLNLPAWTIATNQPEAVSMIVAGDKIIAGTINNKVIVVDSKEKALVWSTEVDGVPYGLAVAHGCLYASTDRGTIFCFDSEDTKLGQLIQKTPENQPYDHNDIYVNAAREIISKTGVTDGYCLDLGCGNGQLACELAKLTNLTIYGLDPDPEMVKNARTKLDRAGFYGSRVSVHYGAIDDSPYPDFFANLIISGRSVVEGAQVLDSTELTRMQRPDGGVFCIGKPGQMETGIRSALEGAGTWTHQYCDPANTITSTDSLIKGPLGILWFRDDDMEMPSRHGRGVGPLYRNGRMFVQGNHGIRAIDAYNGHTLWEYYIEDIMKPYDQEHLTGTAITQGNWCLEGDRLYVRTGPSIANITGRTCLVLDVTNGKLLGEYQVPSAPDGSTEAYWGYIAIDNGILFGTIINQAHLKTWAYRESDMSKLFSEAMALFAMSAATGKVKWIYTAKNSIRHNAIAIGNGRVYLIDRPVPVMDQLRNPHSKTQTAAERTQPTGKLVALDAETGTVLFENNQNIYGTLLALSTRHHVLIMTYQFTRFQSSSESGGKMTAFNATDGKRLWEIDTGVGPGQQYPYSSRPILNDTVIYLEPYAYHLNTGKKMNFNFARTYACGIITSSKHLLLFRSGTLGYVDLTHYETGTQNFGGIRPGCWINALPVGGIVLMPDATDRCNCSYLNKATIALAPMPD